MFNNAALRFALLEKGELARRVNWYIQIRWAFIVVIAVVGVLSEFLILGWSKLVSHDVIGAFGALAANALFYVLSRRFKGNTQTALWALIQIIFDTWLASYIVYIHGGLQSRTIILYAIPIIMAGALFGRIAAYISATLSAGLYALVILMNANGGAGAQYTHAAVAVENNVAVPVLFYACIFFLLAAISDFLSGINARVQQELAEQEAISLASHQLRTPATAVKGFIATALAEHETIPDEFRDLLRQAYEENERELQLVDLMLLAAQIESRGLRLHKEKADLGQLAQDAVHEQLGIIGKRKQHVKMNLPSVPVMGDPRLLRMAAGNLIDNASKYTKEGGTITVQVATDPNGQDVTLSVSDTGIGIAKRDMSKLFKRYVRLDAAARMGVGGTGLGLYTVKKIMDLHEGTVTITSSPEHGSTFIMRLRREHG